MGDIGKHVRALDLVRLDEGDAPAEQAQTVTQEVHEAARV